MRAKKVLEVLGISRATLSNYVKEGRIKTHNSATQWIDYDDESVYAIASKGQRKNVIYARVMNKHNLNKHIEALERYCRENGLHAKDVYKDVTFNVILAQRKGFNKLLDDVISYKIGTVVTLSRKSLSGTDSEFIEILFAKFGCDIRYITEE
jgi:predicted site-specific integrase-resolvase